MKLTIAIVTYNDSKNLTSLLDSITNYEQVMLIDDGSTDNTPKIAKRYPINYIRVNHQGVAKCRNLAISKTKTELLCFLASYYRLPRNFSKEVISAFKDSKIKIIRPALVSKSVSTGQYAMHSILTKYIEGSIGVKPIAISGAAITRIYILKKYGFREDLVTGEDTELGFRLFSKGFRVKYAPHIKVQIIHRKTVWSNMKRFFIYGKDWAKIKQIHPGYECPRNKTLFDLFYEIKKAWSDSNGSLSQFFILYCGACGAYFGK